MITVGMVMQFLGGLGLFLYGVNIASDGLQKIAANRLKTILESLTKKTWLATLFGIAMTVALQSSAATTVMVVEFVNSGIMTLAQALGVALGSAVGTSIVIQLISFPILDLALGMIFIGFILYLIVKTTQARRVGQALIGFGCIFVGMAYLSSAFAPFKNSLEVYAFLSQFGRNPVLGILVSIIITTLIQSSAAFLAILISLSSQGVLSIESIVPLVMGAHIGGTMTTLISSLAAERIDAKRVAIANSFYRVFAAVLLLPFFPRFAELIQWSAADLPRQVANTHLFSAVLMVIIFLPFNKLLAKLLIRFVPQPKGEQEPRTKYIARAALELPAVALSQVHQEIRWLSHKILDNMMQLLPRVMTTGVNKWAEEIEKAEQEVDWHYSQITNFLSALFQRSMTRQQFIESHDFQLIAKELEYIADNLVVMSRIGQKIHSEKLSFAEEDWELFEDLYIAVSGNYLTLINALDRRSKEKAREVLAFHQEIIKLYNKAQLNVICQHRTGELAEKPSEIQHEVQENAFENKTVMIDLVNWMFSIGEHITGIAKIISSE